MKLDSTTPIATKDPIKYVIYARKSSEDEGAQANSIPDQIKRCKDYADRTGKKYIAIIEEDKSAKYPNRRKKFKQMIDDVKSGKIEGIIAYHPDRLARNMLDAGIIIDLLTENYKKEEAPLKALAFPTTEFTNDSSGRLMLAVLFSLATNYSDHLSEVVQRGVTENLVQRGLSSGTPKWGYVRDEETGYYKPDGNFDKVRTAWEMVISGANQKQAIEYLQKEGVQRVTKITRKNKTKRVITIGKDTTLFRDSFYYGELRQSGEVIDLTKQQSDFKPMITRDEFVQAQKNLGGKGAKMALSVNRKGRDFLPLRGLVTCQECGKPMYVSASKGLGGRYVYYACKNKECSRCNKGVRGKVIFDGIYSLLDSIKPNTAAFKTYLDSLDEYIKVELADLKTEKASLNARLSQIKAKKKQADSQYLAVISLGEKAPKGASETAAEACNEIQEDLDNIMAEIANIDSVLADPDLIKLSEEEFSNLLKNACSKMKSGDLVQKDQIARLIFSNIQIGAKKDPHYLLNKEFEGLLKTEKIDSGAPD